MLLPTTERAPDTTAIDEVPPLQALSLMLSGQRASVDAVTSALSDIVKGADLMAAAVQAEHSIHYAAAGSSGLMALADACELPGTFGLPASMIQIHMAGGVPTDGKMPGNTEDDIGTGHHVSANLGQGDVVIVVSASGSTPYALAVAKSAKASGAAVIAVANNRHCPLFEQANVAICLETPPEFVAGSTRLGAATAQKIALNLMSSLMGVKLGHVYQGRMVNLVADNAKLAQRATSTVSQIAEVSERDAEGALKQASGNVKVAILIALGCSINQANDLLDKNNGHLGPCIQSLKSNQDVFV